MALRNHRLRKRITRVLPIAAAVAVLLTALALVSDVQDEASGFSRHYLWVLVLTGLALLVLAAAIVHRVASLVRRVRSEAPGARLAARWVRNFLLLSLVPALIVYGFAAYFLTRTVDGWFDVDVETALADSLALGQRFLDNRTLEVRNQVRRAAAEVDSERLDTERTRRALLRQVSSAGPTELTVVDSGGAVLASANIDALAGLPERPADYALLQARERGEYAAAEPATDGGLRIRVIQRLPASPGVPERYLQAFYPLPEDITTLASSIEREYHRYRNVSYLRDSLEQSFLLILSLVLMLSVLLAILAGLNTARRMVAPISRLSEATRQVAGGDLGQTVSAGSDDELGFLARSFNEMTDALKRASEAAESSRARLEAQGEYLETVLGSLSAGVLTLDGAGRIATANRAAGRILGLPGNEVPPGGVATLAGVASGLEPLTDLIAKALSQGRREWQREVKLEREGGPLVLLVRGSRLPERSGEHDGGGPGHVVVFDDVTILNRAQREAAWSEVAQRLAHEVKNPLTPIRLAAERLRMKLMDKLEPADGRVLDRSATTIVAQVEALRTLVDAFGDYAREPRIERRPLRLDALIEEVVALYRDTDPRLSVETDLCEGPEGLEADSGRLRQLLHNLLRNAGEARADGEATRARLATRVVGGDEGQWLELTITDDGPGFPEAVLDNPFEPYVTHKPDGSGLGLAICRKIVAEHDGTIEIANAPGGGAVARIRLPLGRAGRGVRPPRERGDHTAAGGR